LIPLSGADYPRPSSLAASAVMRANVKEDTGPEIRLRAALHRRGLRFRKHLLIRAGDVRVKPDIVFTRKQVAVFIDGCFWHGCSEHGTQPKSNAAYWSAKIAGNQERDRRVTLALEEAGWTVVRRWEHDSADDSVAVIAATLESCGV
jgi:DNA mismatch endonuclease (patch repair protein)